MADALSTLDVGSPYPRPLATPPLGPRRAPTLTVTAGDRRALLSWVAPPGADGEFVWVRDRTANTVLKRLPARHGGTTWEATGLINGHEYAFLLQPAKGTHAAAADVRSNVVAVVPRPPSLGPLAVTASPYGVATVSWSRVERASGYQLEMRAGTGTWRHVASTASPSYRVTGLRPAASYSFRVFARRDGVRSDWSPTATVLVPLPRPVTEVTAGSPSKDVAVVSGRGTGEATSYQVSVHRASSCTAPAPTGCDVVRTGLAEPRARLTPTATYLWVRLRSVRMGVTSGLDVTSTACLHVR